MCNNNYEIIRNAIIEKEQIIATYNGHFREMCPHVLGSKKGRMQALFFQFGGTSSSGNITGDSENNWRCIPVEELGDVTARPGSWHSVGYNSKTQKSVDNIDVEVRLPI